MSPVRLAAFVTMILLAPALSASAAETSLTMSSQPGDYVGGGQQYFYDKNSAVFTPSLLGNGNGAQVFVNEGSFQSWWYLNFAAPDGSMLAPGTYVGATRYLGFGQTTPGIDVFGNGRGCNQQAGAFQVKQLTIEQGVLTKLWVRFEQHCEGGVPALTGDLRFNADVSLLVVAPLEKKVAIGQTVTFDVTATGAPHITLSVEGLPAGATFDDHGDNTGTFSWTPTKDQIGSQAITFVGGAVPNVDRSTTIVQVAERPLTGDTSLRMVSDPGDFIGQGLTYFYGAGDGTFTGFAQNNGNLARLSFRNDVHNWDLEFAAADGAPLAPGFYPNAKRYPFQGAGVPGFDVSGDGRGCNMLSGAFEVKQLVVSGTTVTRFWARFEQHCENGPPALAGEIRLNADVTVAVSAPFSARFLSAQLNALDVSASAAAGGHVTLSALGVPPGATFEDLGNNTGRLTWTPTLDQRGSFDVVFVGDDGLGHQDRSTTRLVVEGVTSLALDSEIGEPLAQGNDAFYTPANGTFRVGQRFYANAVTFDFIGPDYHPNWSIALAAPNNAVLTPGNYEGAVGYSSDNSKPEMQVSGNGAGCTDLVGRFVVRQAEYGPNNTVTAFWATFEETCGPATVPLRGELRYNARVVTDVTAPAADTTSPGQPMQFTVLATNAYGRTVRLLPNGTPRGANFVDNGDNTGTFTWTPAFDQIGNYAVTFVGDDGAGGIDSATTRLVVPGQTALILLDSDTGPRTITPEDGTFTGSRPAANNRVLIHFREAHESYYGWDLTFGAPQNAVLEPGFFPGASIEQLIGQSAPAPTYPILMLEHNGGSNIYCNPRLGLFEVKQAKYGQGGAIESFWARFEQKCTASGVWKVGEIRFNAAIEVAVRAALSGEVAPGGTYETFVTASDRLGRHVTLTAQGLPAGASFEDRGDNTGTFRWTPGADAIGLHDVTFTGDNGNGGVDHSSLHLRVTGQTRLVIDGDPGDPVGGNRSNLFAANDGRFEAMKNYKEGVDFHFVEGSGSGYLPDWYVSMSGPQSITLAPRVYEPVTYFPYAPFDEAGLAVTHGYDPCGSAIDGRFEVVQITYGPGAEIASVRATFEQHCQGAVPGVRGELRWNYDAPVLISAPTHVDTTDGSRITVPVTAIDRAGGVLTLTATALPAGALFTDHGNNTGTLEWTPTAQQVGDYRVTFHARNAAGDEDSTWTRIHVRHLDLPPVPRIAFQSPVVPGVPVTFDASGSDDPEGGALYYYWYFEDDGSYSYQPVVSHTFTKAGTFTVGLQVFDGMTSATAETLVTVQGVLAARAFASGGDAVVRPQSGKPTTCVQIEPRDAAWLIGNADLSSIAMVSKGTGSVDRISALADRTALDRDTDKNGIAEISACFAKSDLAQLFSNVSGKRTVLVTIEGKLASGESFQGSMDLPVSRPGGALAAEAVPTNALHGYRLSFVTARPGPIDVRLYDVTGRLVRSLADTDDAPAGPHDFMVDRNDLPSGVYFYRIRTPEGVAGGRLVLLQ